MTSITDTTRFLQAIFPDHAKHAIFANCPDLAKKPRPRFWHSRDVGRLDPSINCYFSLGAYPDDDDTGRTADRVVEMRVFALDDVGEPGKLTSVEAAEKLGVPTAKVRSSRDSVQWLYRLSRGVTPAEWPALVEAIKVKIGVPALECVDLAHVVRLPMGINNKNEDGRRGWKVKLEELNPGAALDVAELLLFWAPVAGPPAALKRVTGTRCVHDIKRLVALVPNEDMAYDAWIAVGQRIKAKAIDEADGLKAYIEFSARSGKNNLKQDTEHTWSTLLPSRTTGDLLQDAAWAADPEGYMAWTLAEPARPGATEAFDDGEAPPKPTSKAAPHVLASGEFVAGFIPPDYLVKKLITKAFLYSLTGQTGAGKTSITLRLAATVARGLSFGGLGTKPCRVLYLAAENPVDIQMRWLALGHEMGFDVNTIQVFFVKGWFKIGATMKELRAEALRVGGEFGLVVVDTGPVFFEGEDANDRVAQLKHARMMRELIEVIPGGPSVIVNVHPVKNAGPDNLLPSGGGSFLNEVDGNLTAAKNEDQTIELSWQGKWRGVEFAPLHFLLKTATHPRLIDSDGEAMPTVVCEHLSSDAKEVMERAEFADQDKLLAEMARNPKASIAELAIHMGWHYASGKPDKSKAQRYVKTLTQQKLAKRHLQLWVVAGAAKSKLNGNGGRIVSAVSIRADTIDTKDY